MTASCRLLGEGALLGTATVCIGTVIRAESKEVLAWC